MRQIPPEIITAARATQAKWAVPASVTIAQWALESAFGEHMPSGSNNPFGIKARPGEPSVTAMTREVLHGQSVHIPQAFRKFASIEEAFELHGQLLHDGRPYRRAMMLTDSPDAFANALTGVYATDPNYGSSLIRLMHTYNLYQYDKPALQVANSGNLLVSAPRQSEPIPAPPPPRNGGFWSSLLSIFRKAA